jgi:hypothetical protein
MSRERRAWLRSCHVHVINLSQRRFAKWTSRNGQFQGFLLSVRARDTSAVRPCLQSTRCGLVHMSRSDTIRVIRRQDQWFSDLLAGAVMAGKDNKCGWLVVAERGTRRLLACLRVLGHKQRLAKHALILGLDPTDPRADRTLTLTP